MAIARGVPTVMYSQGVVALGVPDEETIVPNRVHLYKDYSRFPFDVADGDLETLVRKAALSEAPVAAWKRRFIGKQFHPLGFVELFERLVIGGPTPPRIDPTRTHTTLAFADELVERPDLLRAYVEVYGPGDDASLVLWTPGVGAQELLEQAETAIERPASTATGSPTSCSRRCPARRRSTARSPSAPTRCSATGPRPAASARCRGSRRGFPPSTSSRRARTSRRPSLCRPR